MQKISKFGQVASSLAGALIVLAACNTPPLTQPGLTPLPGKAKTGDDVSVVGNGATSALEFTLRLAEEAPASQRQVLALPAETTEVAISISGAPLGDRKVTAVIKRESFTNGVAKITLENLPVGTLTVGVNVKGANGVDLGSGTAQAKVEAGKINPVKVVVKAAATTGGLAIEVDSDNGGFASLPRLTNQRIDRLAIPSLVLVFYGYNGFNRGVLGDPVPINTTPPANIAPLTLLQQVKDGTIKDPTRKALQAGFDGMDKYNAEDPKVDRAVTAPYYVAALKAIFNRKEADAKGLSELLTPDMQVVDINKTGGFLASGRMLKDDVVDTELKALSGVSAASDKIDKNDKDFSTTFPFLAEPF